MICVAVDTLQRYRSGLANARVALDTGIDIRNKEVIADRRRPCVVTLGTGGISGFVFHHLMAGMVETGRRKVIGGQSDRMHLIT
jgi:hypothetical protein